MHEFNEFFIQILVLLAVGIGITMIANYLKQPYSIALVVVGLLLGLLHLPLLEKTKDFITQSTVFQFVIISVFLPTLLGEATLKLPFSYLKENKKPILALAFGGTFLSFLLIGTGSYFVMNLSLVMAFTFAALMSATDPISVLSIFKSIGVNKKLTTIIEGESLFNDGIAVVLFTIASVYLESYLALGWGGLGNGVLLFLKFVLGGLIIGAIFGLLGSFTIKPIDNYPLEITVSFLVFFGSFFTAETVHVSGVISVVVAGLIFGNYGSKIGMSAVTRLNINIFWDVIAFIANSLIFLMVGLEINQIDFAGKWGLILLAIVIVLLSRSIAVYSSTWWIKELKLKHKHVLNWGGLKGSLSIALALSLPYDFPGREEILIFTFSVVLFSLIIQGFTIKPLIKKLGVIEKNQGIQEYEDTIAHIYRLQKAIKKWEEMYHHSFILEEEFLELKDEAEKKVKVHKEELTKLYEKYPQIKEEQLHDAKKDALYIEHESISDLVQREIISYSVGDAHKRKIIERIDKLEQDH